jgi:hypothetical protein
MSTPAQESAPSRLLLPLVAVVAVVAVVVAMVVGVSALRAASGSTPPPVLHLASVWGGSLDAPAASAAGALGQGTARAPNRTRPGWRLAGTLPQGPSSGPVHLLPAGPLSRGFVTALARSLGMSGQPQHLRGGWYLASGTTELSVSELAGRHWVYANHGCLAGPVLDPQRGSACAVSSSTPPVSPGPGAKSTPGRVGVKAPPITSSPAPVPQPTPVPQNIAASIARPVLAAVGVNADAAQVETGGGQQSVVSSPVVAGLGVQGLETRVSIDEHGQIVDASGWLAPSTTGPTYPLISARQAYDELLARPQPMTAMPLLCRRVAGQAGCAPVPDRVVTGATLGLTQAYNTDGSILLVPAWLFHLRGEPASMSVVAIDQVYLAEPNNVTVPGAISGASGPNASTGNAGSPTQVQPQGPATAPATTTTR